MIFFYSMYGETIESLSVLVRSRVNGSASRVWSRYGNLKTSSWTEGCIAFNYSGNYQVGLLTFYRMFTRVLRNSNIQH